MRRAKTRCAEKTEVSGRSERALKTHTGELGKDDWKRTNLHRAFDKQRRCNFNKKN